MPRHHYHRNVVSVAMCMFCCVVADRNKWRGLAALCDYNNQDSQQASKLYISIIASTLGGKLCQHGMQGLNMVNPNPAKWIKGTMNK